MTEFHSNHPLAIFLEAAVPLHIMELQRRGGPTEEDFQRVKEFGLQLAAEGDALLFPVKGKTAALANRLAEAVAIMAFVPGGTKVFGTRYEARPLDQG